MAGQGLSIITASVAMDAKSTTGFKGTVDETAKERNEIAAVAAS